MSYHCMFAQSEYGPTKRERKGISLRYSYAVRTLYPPPRRKGLYGATGKVMVAATYLCTNFIVPKARLCTNIIVSVQTVLFRTPTPQDSLSTSPYKINSVNSSEYSPPPPINTVNSAPA